MFINIKIKKTWNTYNSFFLGFRYETFYYLFEFKVFRYERETQFLSILTFPSDPAANYRSGLGELQKSTPPPSKSKSQLFSNSKSSAHRFRAWRHSHPQFHFLSGVFIVTSVIVTSFPRMREHLHSMCAPNKPMHSSERFSA